MGRVAGHSGIVEGTAATADRELTVTTTTSAGVDRKHTNLHDLQLSAETLEDLTDGGEGQLLTLTADHGDFELEHYGRVECRDDRFADELAPDEIGVGVHCRRGLGVDTGDRISVRACDLDALSPQRRLMNRLLKIRPASCRVRKTTSPDAGFKVCRLPDEVKDLIGIEWGDRVVIQSANARLHGMKALPIRDGLASKYERRIAKRPHRYPPPFPGTTIAERAGIIVDLPQVYLSAGAREELDLPDGGSYQPVKVHRDTADVYIRLFVRLSLPIILGAATIIIGFDPSTPVKLITLVVGVLVALIAIVLHARRVLLE